MSGRTAERISPTVFVIDDDPDLRCSLQFMLEQADLKVSTSQSAEEFLENCDSDMPGCLLLDVRLKGMSGLILQKKLAELNWHLPIIIMSAYADVPMVIEAIDAGVMSFIEKPFHRNDLFSRIFKALKSDEKLRKDLARLNEIKKLFTDLTEREYQVMKMVIAGKKNEEVAQELNLSNIVVELDLASIFRKTGVQSLAELISLAIKSDDELDMEIHEIW